MISSTISRTYTKSLHYTSTNYTNFNYINFIKTRLQNSVVQVKVSMKVKYTLAQIWITQIFPRMKCSIKQGPCVYGCQVVLKYLAILELKPGLLIDTHSCTLFCPFHWSNLAVLELINIWQKISAIQYILNLQISNR